MLDETGSWFWDNEPILDLSWSLLRSFSIITWDLCCHNLTRMNIVKQCFDFVMQQRAIWSFDFTATQHELEFFYVAMHVWNVRTSIYHMAYQSVLVSPSTRNFIAIKNESFLTNIKQICREKETFLRPHT